MGIPKALNTIPNRVGPLGLELGLGTSFMAYNIKHIKEDYSNWSKLIYLNA